MDSLSTAQRSSTWAIAHAVTLLGKNHQTNEDKYLLEFWPDRSSLLAVVADGMGGNLAGEVAAQIAVDTFRKLLDRPLPVDSRERYDLLRQFNYLGANTGLWVGNMLNIFFNPDTNHPSLVGCS